MNKLHFVKQLKMAVDHESPEKSIRLQQNSNPCDTSTNGLPKET